MRYLPNRKHGRLFLHTTVRFDQDFLDKVNVWADDDEYSIAKVLKLYSELLELQMGVDDIAVHCVERICPSYLTSDVIFSIPSASETQVLQKILNLN